MGITTSLKDTEIAYIVGEYIRGKYLLVIEIKSNIRLIDRKIRYNFRNYNKYKKGETRFYKRNIINLVIPYMESLNIKFKKLTEEEINNLIKIDKVIEDYDTWKKIEN